MTLTAVIVLYRRENISNVLSLVSSLSDNPLLKDILKSIFVVNSWDSSLVWDCASPMVHVIEMGKNYGPMTARLKALQQCKTTHIWFIDDDDQVLQTSSLIHVDWKDDIDIYRFSRIAKSRYPVDYGCDEYILGAASSVRDTPLWNKIFRTQVVLEAMADYMRKDFYLFFYYSEDVFLSRMVFKYLGDSIKVEDMACLVLYSSNSSVIEVSSLDEAKHHMEHLFKVNQSAREIYTRYGFDLDAVMGGLIYFIRKLKLPSDFRELNELKSFLRPLLRESSSLYGSATDKALDLILDCALCQNSIYTIPLFDYGRHERVEVSTSFS